MASRGEFGAPCGRCGTANRRRRRKSREEPGPCGIDLSADTGDAWVVRPVSTCAGIGIGTTKAPTVSYISPTDPISATATKRAIAGLTFEFLCAPDTEAPEEMHIWIPQLKELTCAENANHSLHNIRTLRGARTHDARNFARYLEETLGRWGDDPEVHFGPHTWPVWDNADIVLIGDNASQADIRIDFAFTDLDQSWTVWVRRGVLNARLGASPDAQLTVSGPKAALVGVVLQPARRRKVGRGRQDSVRRR